MDHIITNSEYVLHKYLVNNMIDWQIPTTNFEYPLSSCDLTEKLRSQTTTYRVFQATINCTIRKYLNLLVLILMQWGDSSKRRNDVKRTSKILRYLIKHRFDVVSTSFWHHSDIILMFRRIPEYLIILGNWDMLYKNEYIYTQWQEKTFQIVSQFVKAPLKCIHGSTIHT